MAATAEASDALDEGRRALDDLGAAVITRTPWLPTGDRSLGDWYLELEFRPNELDPSGPIPASTRWIAIAGAEYPLGDIHIMPAATGSITATFPHQLANDAAEAGRPWRTGKICIVDTVHGHELAAKRDDPLDAYARLAWHVDRALGWLTRASKGELLAAGEPFELPIFGQFNRVGPRVGFHEGSESFEIWQGSSEASGFADLVEVGDSSGNPVVAVQTWRDRNRNELFRPPWGQVIAVSRRSEEALWFRFDHLLVEAPWRSPQTIGELIEFAKKRGIDILDRLRQAERILRDGRAHFLLLGFPIPRVVGEVPSRMAWVAFQVGPLTEAVRKGRKEPTVPGFRNKTGAWFADRLRGGPLEDARPISWARSENWHPDELAARGRFEGGLAGRRVVLIGAGAFGSGLAALLVRGGVRQLSVLDAGRVEAANLARHELGIRDLGLAKATALAARLNVLSPSAAVQGFDQSFPPIGAALRAVDEADILIDATASETAILALGAHSWDHDVEFASVSFSFGAEKLYVYRAAGRRFPSEDFMKVMAPWIAADARPVENFPHEGTGCWSSVFPARADDVALLAAIAARQIDAHPPELGRDPVLTVFKRELDGTVSIVPEPAKG